MSDSNKLNTLRNMVRATIIKGKAKPSVPKGDPTKEDKPENTLVVIRHGATQMNNDSDEKFRGWADIPLSDEGRAQAKKTGKELKSKGLDGIVTSDLGRCIETANIVSKETGAPVLGKKRGLRPWHLGDLTGQPVKPNLEALKAYITNSSIKVPGGESFDTFKKRMVDEVLKIQKKYPKDKIAIVTHHRGERLIKSWMDVGQPSDPGKLSSEPFMHKGIKPGAYVNHEIPPKK